MTRTKPSKTAQKSEQLALQELGERLIGLSADDLSHLPIDDRLRDAVLAASAMSARGALRRQKQLIGKLMRQADAEPIRRALDIRSADERLGKRLFADAERWRDRIVSEGRVAIDDFCRETGTDNRPLVEMLGELRRTVNEKTARSLRRRIFRCVHDTLMARARDDRIPR